MCSFINVIYIISIEKTVSPPWTSVPNIIITDIISLLSLCTWFRFFGCLVYKFPPIVANYVKHVSPILHSFGIISFALSKFLPIFCQYFIVGISPIETIINVSADLANAIIHYCCIILWPFSPDLLPKYGRGNFWYFFIGIIKLRILWNTTTMTQHWNISRLEVLCLPTNLVQTYEVMRSEERRVVRRYAGWKKLQINSTEYAQAWLEGTILQVCWCFNVGS